MSIKFYNPMIQKGRVLTYADRALIVSPAHDKPGRSASLLWDSLFEVADTFMPKAVYNFFTKAEMFKDINFLESIPEHHTAFDNLGKGRMHDLVILADCAGENITIAIEAKVDEPFDNKTIRAYRDQGLAIQASGKNSNKPARIAKLLDAVFPKSQHLSVEDLKYQLLQASAGTLAEAKRYDATKAIFCILNFKPKAPSEAYVFKNKHNSIHLNDFVKAFPGASVSEIETNQLYGPVNVPGDADIPNDIPLYFLKLEQVF